MRIALIGNQAFAAVNFRGPLIRTLVQAGHEVYALAPDFDDDSRAGIRNLGAHPLDFPLERTSLNPLVDLRTLVVLVRLLRRHEIDAVLCYFIKPVIYGTLAAWLARVPRRLALIEGAGYVFDGRVSTWPRRVLRRCVVMLYRFALRRAHRIFVLNRDDEDLFLRRRIARPGQLQVLPGIGIDLMHYTEAPPYMQTVTFCLMARLIEAKGVRVYAEAARLLKRQHPEIRVLLLGGLEDDVPGNLGRAEILEWVNEGTLEWPGKVEDVRDYLRETSVLVLPSHYREGLPRSILEAMAMARAVITTDNPGCRDAVTDGEQGFIVPVRNPVALCRAMERFILEPDLIRSMGEAARAAAVLHYDVDRVNATFLQSLQA